MPETPDWSAAPAAAVTTKMDLLLSTEAAPNYLELLAVPGQRITIVGLGLFFSVAAGEKYSPRGTVSMVANDSISGAQVGGGAIAPGSPFAYLAYPPGALILSVGADLGLQLCSELGAGAQFVYCLTHYYYI